jgi:acetoin utilization deacetylase AcuC-like enzyme
VFVNVIFHDDFYLPYTCDPAAEGGRMEAIVAAVQGQSTFIPAEPAPLDAIAAVHAEQHIDSVRRVGLYDIAARAAGGAMQAARLGLAEPAFALIRPPGHHASHNRAWGFCFFNNMAVALVALKISRLITTALVLDIDLHFGDGTVNIMGSSPWVTIVNPASTYRNDYLDEVTEVLAHCPADIIGISAGFDHHVDDWGGLLYTSDYQTIGSAVRQAASRNGGGYFAILEGGYNHAVLGQNVSALLAGMEHGQRKCTAP